MSLRGCCQPPLSPALCQEGELAAWDEGMDLESKSELRQREVQEAPCRGGAPRSVAEGAWDSGWPLFRHS